MTDVVLIGAGGANIGSVRFALERLGVESTVSDDPGRVHAASHAILPGVGAAGPAMARLRASGLDTVIRDLTQPVLGVCLGMQLLFEYSEEGDTPCLGVIPGKVRRFSSDTGLRVPHMGWNSLIAERGDPLCRDLETIGAHAYFVHSYAAPPGPDTLVRSDYGTPFSAVVRRGNFCGTQFHPERSAAVGELLLSNFLKLPSP